MKTLTISLPRCWRQYYACLLTADCAELHFGWINLLWGLMLFVPYWSQSQNPIVVAQRELFPMFTWAFVMTTMGASQIVAVVTRQTRARQWCAMWNIWFWTFCSYVISRADIRFPGVVLCPTYSIAMFFALRRLSVMRAHEAAPAVLSDEERRTIRLAMPMPRSPA